MVRTSTRNSLPGLYVYTLARLVSSTVPTKGELMGRIDNGLTISRKLMSGTYDHRLWKTGLPVRVAVFQPHVGRLVVWLVATSES